MNKIKLNLNSGIELANCIMEATGTKLYVDESVSMEDVLKEVSDNMCPGVGIYLLNMPSSIPVEYMVTGACGCIADAPGDDEEGIKEYCTCSSRNLNFYKNIRDRIESGERLIEAIYWYNQSEDFAEAMWVLTGNNL